VAFRIKDLTGGTWDVVDLDGNNVTNRGKRVDDINEDVEPATVTVAQVNISGVGADTLEFWYFGPYTNGATFNIALVDPSNTCDTIYIASGSYNCTDNTGISDPGACDNDVPLFFLDFSQTEFDYGGGGGGNENFDEIFLIMQRSREEMCCDLLPSNQRCFEFIVRLADQDVGLAIDDVGSGATAGEFYADTLNMFTCTGTSANTWPFTQSGGQSSDLPLCLTGGGGQEFVVLSCKSGNNVTGASVDAISNIIAPPEATIEPCNVTLEVFNIDSAIWSSPDDPNLANFQSCNGDSLFCTFFYDVMTFGEVTACEGDTFVYIVGGMPADNECIAADTILYDTTYVVVYPTFTVEIDTMCNSTSDSLVMTANVISAAMGCQYAFAWSNGDSTQTITVPFSDTEFFVTVTRADLPEGSQECVVAADSIVASGGLAINCDNIQDTLYTCVNELPDPDTTLVTFTGCATADPFIYSEDASNGGSGCIGDTLVITRLYIVDFDGDLMTPGDRDTCVQELSFVDDVPPVITSGCPADITITCDSQVPSPGPTALTATDNCGGSAIITHGGDIVSDSTCANRYTITRIYVATDNCGNSSTCSQVISVFDDMPPSITCPTNISVSCASDIPAPDINSVTSTDNCGGGAPVIAHVSDITINVVCANRFTVVRTYSATDVCGNTATCTQGIIVFDAMPPSITCPPDLSVECASEVPMPDIGSVTTSDNCGGMVSVEHVSDVITSMICANRFTVIRTYRATDDCGNSATCAQSIFVFDDTVPVITCPADMTVECSTGVPAPDTASVTASDNCGGNPVIEHVLDAVSDSSCLNRYTLTRTYRATDACGNSATCNQVFTVYDDTPPTIICPDDVTVTCESDVPAPVTSGITASDNCPGTVIVGLLGDVTINEICENRYTINRTYQAVDVCGNTATCVQVITVFDDVPPVITCPTNITVECSSDVPPPNTASVTGSDNCGGPVIIGFLGDVISNQTCLNRYLITRIYQASDLCGNTATCTQNIIVFDDTPPSITCPPTITVSCAADIPPADTGSITTSDNCPGTVMVTSSDEILAIVCPNNFTMARTFTATDVCGNSATCTQSIIVADLIPPVITCPADLTVTCDFQVPAPDTTQVTASDNCGGGTIAHVGDFVTDSTCVNRKTITRVYSVTDSCQLTTTCAQIITIFDNVPPDLTCPDDITISNETIPDPQNTGNAFASDNCEGTPDITFSDITIEGNCPGDYSIVRTWLATDECGNSASCSQNIIVEGACSVDLALEKVLNPGQNPISGGDNVTFTITVTNEGLQAVGSITVIDYIPLGFSLNDPDWTAGNQGSTGQSATIILSTGNGALPPGGLTPTSSVSVEITLQAAPDISPGVYINIGEITTVFDTEGNNVSNDDQDSDPDTNDANDPDAEDDHDPVAICVITDVVILGSPFVCTGDTITYSVEGYNPADTYMWLLSGGGNIIENNDSSIVVEWTAPPGGPYTITVLQISGPDCQSTGTLDVTIQGGEAIACLDHINLSIDNECGTVVTSGMILTGEQAGNNNYTVYIIDMNGDTVPNATLTWMHVGQTFKVSVVSICSGQSCWGLMTVEDKLPPQLLCSCPIDNENEFCEINCLQIEAFLAGDIPGDLIPIPADNCGGTTLELVDVVLDYETCEGGAILTTWLATDAAGNTSTCTQEYSIIPLTLDSLVFPTDYFGECDDSSDPSVTGWPQADGINLSNIPGHCNILATYTDNVLDLCGGGTKIIRHWTVFDWCVPDTREFFQFIILTDQTGPVLTCSDDITVGTDAWYCYANIIMTTPTAIDACSSIKSYHLFSPEGTVVQIGNNFRINELPIGTHTVRWTVYDECHNSSECSFDITVIDNVPPVPACQAHLVVSLTNDRPNGITLVPADAFDDGSFDNCSDVSFRARRMDSCIDFDWTTEGACIDDIPGGFPPVNAIDYGTVHGICVPFGCCDIGAGPIMVELEVTDASGNVNYCMVEITVQDKLAPEVICPPDISVSCEFEFEAITGTFRDEDGNNDGSLDEDPLSELFGNVFDAFRHLESERSDIIINDPNNDQQTQPFNWGIDGWAYDNCQVNLEVVVNVYEDCSGQGLIGDPPPGAVKLVTRRFIGRDDSGNPTPGSCVQNIWVIDYSPFFITDTTCGNANPLDGVIWPCDVLLNTCPESLDETGEPVILDDHCSIIGTSFEDTRFDFADGSCYKVLREWFIIDWCQFDFNTGAGIWSYTQEIKVLDSFGPELLECPQSTVELCLGDPGITLPDNNQTNLGENNPNASNCSVHVAMSQRVRELCSGSVIYDVKLYPFNGDEYIQLKSPTVLQLDANHEGDMTFDTEQSSIQSISQDGLPYNDPLCDDFHRLVWTVTDGCGNLSTCDHFLRLEDCKDPTPVCVNGLSSVIMQDEGQVTIWASDFDASSFDDCTPNAELLFSFSGTSYQPSFTYTCDNVPVIGDTIEVEIWVADAGSDANCNGQVEWGERNTDFCVTYIIIDDPNGVCDQEGLVLEGEILTEYSDAVSQTSVQLTGPSGSIPAVITGNDGKYTFANVIPGEDYTITAQRNDQHRNGVSTLDLIRIQKHLLGKEAFSSPYQYIAADANNSGTVSAVDLIELRKLILGLYQELPDNHSWRFVVKDSEMDPSNPWPFTEFISIENLPANEISNIDFVGVKVGDVNNTVKANALQVLPRNGNRVLDIHAVNRETIRKGGELDVKFIIPELVSGFQWTLELDGLQFERIESKLMPIDMDNIAVHADGHLTMSWNGEQASNQEKREMSFIMKFIVLEEKPVNEMITLTHSITEAEAYSLSGEILDVRLVFDEARPFTDFALYQNQPNPWNGQTLIGFDLPEEGIATLTVYDVAGKVVKTISNSYRRGYNTIMLTSRDLPSSGILYYRLESGGYSATKKMMIFQ
jgi:uncharacterized repeat protein (TIGR01451 family)